MAQRCTICRHPQKIAIEQALVADESERTIADRFGLSKTAVHRHKTSHLHTSLTHALERRVEREEDELLEFAILKQSERAKAQNERWGRIQAAALECIEKEDYKGAAALLRELLNLEKLVAQEHGQFDPDKTKTGPSAPSVIIVRPPVDAGRIPASLPVAQTVQFPDGAPREILEAEWSELPEPGPGSSESEEAGGDDGAVENRAQAAYEVFNIADFE